MPSGTFSRFLLLGSSHHFQHVTAAGIVGCGGITAMASGGLESDIDDDANNHHEGGHLNNKTKTNYNYTNGFNNQLRFPSFFMTPSSCSFISSCEKASSAPPPSTTTPSTTKPQRPRIIPPPRRPRPISSSPVDIRKRMTHVGRFSLVIETPTNPMVSVLFVALKGRPFTNKDFIDLYHQKSIDTKYERFRATLLNKTSSNNDDKNSSSSSSSSSFFNTNNMTHFIIRNKLNLDKIITQAITYPLIYRKEIKDWTIEAQMQPLDVTQSLWDAKIFTGGTIGQSGVIPVSSTSSNQSDDDDDDDDEDAVESLLLFRAHHCMADGVSLGAIFTDLADEGQQLKQAISDKIIEFKKGLKKKGWWQRLQIIIYYWWWGSIKSIMYQLYLYWQSIIKPDPWNQLRLAATATSNSPQESASRTISWVEAADLDQLKDVANYYSQYTRGKVTVNDMVCSCVSAATSKLIRYHQSRLSPHVHISNLPYMNIVIPVHMQGGILLPNQNLGNKIGALVCRVPAQQQQQEIGKGKGSSCLDDYTTNAPTAAQERLIKVHDVLYQRKRTPAAVLSYLVAMTFGYVGTAEPTTSAPTIVGDGGTATTTTTTTRNNTKSGILPWLFEKAHAKASVAITNVRGPEHPIHFDGRRVEAVLGFLPLPAGVPIGIAVFSYNNKLSLTVVGEPWAVPDADLYLSWIVEEYQELLQQAARNKK